MQLINGCRLTLSRVLAKNISKLVCGYLYLLYSKNKIDFPLVERQTQPIRKAPRISYPSFFGGSPSLRGLL